MKTPHVRNLDRLNRKLAHLGDIGQANVLEEALHAGAQEILNSAKDKAPYLTGTLRRSLHSDTVEKQGVRVRVLVGTDLVYAAQIGEGYRSGADADGKSGRKHCRYSHR